MKDQWHVGVLGATSLVGRLLLPQLIAHGCKVTAFTREACETSVDGVTWHQLSVSKSSLESQSVLQAREVRIPLWISVAPIWVLKNLFPLLEAYGVRRIVALSSTSRFTKFDSSDFEDQQTAHRLAEAEEAFRAWAERQNVEWIILRPTLIYGFGGDKNITEIVRFIRRFGFFPVYGNAEGLRQPIHAVDVVEVSVVALLKTSVRNREYNISGGEIITYREMVKRVFITMGQPVRVIPVPLCLYRMAIVLLRKLPRFRHWSPSMVLRMNSDMVFQHGEATRDLGFRPRNYLLSAEDVQG